VETEEEEGEERILVGFEKEVGRAFCLIRIGLISLFLSNGR
jgi:hypothetical protein